MSGFSFDVKWASQGERQKPTPVGCQTDINEILKKTRCLGVFAHDLCTIRKQDYSTWKRHTRTLTRAKKTTRRWPRGHFHPDRSKGKKTLLVSEGRISLQNLCRAQPRFDFKTSILFQTNTTKWESVHLSDPTVPPLSPPASEGMTLGTTPLLGGSPTSASTSSTPVGSLTPAALLEGWGNPGPRTPAGPSAAGWALRAPPTLLPSQ